MKKPTDLIQNAMSDARNSATARPASSAATPRTPPIDVDSWCQFFQFNITGNEAEKRSSAEMITESAHFINAIRNGLPPRWLSFLGTSASGKTYLARAIWNWYRKSEFFRATVGADVIYPGTWCDWPELAGRLQSNQGYEQIQELSTEKLVVLDEIGADRDKNGHVKDQLARLCSARVGKWTIITSNMTLEDVKTHLDQRIPSRMLRDGSVVVDVRMRDYNLRK